MHGWWYFVNLNRKWGEKMASKGHEDKIPEQFLTQSYAVLRLEYGYIKKKRQLLINLRRGLKNIDLREVIEVIQFIGGKPLKSLGVVLGCRADDILKTIKTKDKETLKEVLGLIIGKCIKSYTSQMKYIRSQIPNHLDEDLEDGKTISQ